MTLMTYTPNDLHYAETHEWAKLEDDSLVRVGITDFAQHQLCDLVFIDLPEIGRYLSVNDPCATVESVKAASELYAPVSGEIVAINQAVMDEPELVNDDPYGNWLFCIKADDIDELDSLMDSEAYQNKLNDE
jgi:glycine cleavage system H protein